MFSYEDRLRAVQLFIKLGKHVGLTIRQLGYPTEKALKNWRRAYEQRLDMPAGYVRRPRLHGPRDLPAARARSVAVPPSRRSCLHRRNGATQSAAAGTGCGLTKPPQAVRTR